MKLSLYVGERRDLERSLAAIVAPEGRGLHGVWLAGVRSATPELAAG